MLETIHHELMNHGIPSVWHGGTEIHILNSMIVLFQDNTLIHGYNGGTKTTTIDLNNPNSIPKLIKFCKGTQ